MDTNNEVKPSKSFPGKSTRKSFSWYREVRMERNKNKAVTEKHRATSEVTAKITNAGWLSRFGVPLFSLTPPGTVVDVAEATVAVSAATTEQDSEVLFSHSPPSLTRFLWFSVKISAGVLLSLSVWQSKYLGTVLLTSCIEKIIHIRAVLSVSLNNLSRNYTFNDEKGKTDKSLKSRDITLYYKIK